jgi:hypothetical protein
MPLLTPDAAQLYDTPAWRYLKARIMVLIFETRIPADDVTAVTAFPNVGTRRQ